ncbi:MAG: alkaline phosphatase family protein [Candidatus Poseidoniaceae archaeon]|nr:alkaline phosphatase family protein [Candidatus Poseidoniaceae archaeon]
MSNSEIRFQAKLTRLVVALFLLSLPSLMHTGTYITSESPSPKEGMEASPFPDEPLSEGLLMIVLDGGRIDEMLNPELMPNLNSQVANGTLLMVQTNPITMTAMCVKEMATGVPTRPNEALRNFHPTHPGTPDGYNLASTHDADGDGVYDYRVGILGDYVWSDLYPNRELIPFSKHRYGHADYYEGDEESFVTLNNWIQGTPPKGYSQAPNIIVAHLAGLDSIGHRYTVTDSSEYNDKLIWLDDKMGEIFAQVPDDWTVVVTADHGLTDSGQHGSPAEIIRQVGAFMWGPNIAEGVIVEDVEQRDLATIPSVLFSLPLPHSIHGKIPFDALNVSAEKRSTLEQWNWQAAVARNQWMEDEGHYYVEGLDANEIEWDKLVGDEMGIRNSDLILAGFAFLLFCFFAFQIFTEKETSNTLTYQGIMAFSGLFALSAILSSNREIWSNVYYFPGLLGPLTLFALAYWRMKQDPSDDDEWVEKTWLPYALFASLIFTIVYPETRFSILIMAMFLVFVFNKETYSRNIDLTKQTSRMLLYPFVILLGLAIFFSDNRFWGVSIPRYMTTLMFSEVTSAVIAATIFAFITTLIFTYRNQHITNSKLNYAIAIAFATLPYCMSQSNNTLDWFLLSILMLSVAAAAYYRTRNGKLSSELFHYAAFAWLTMSWGAWAGGTTMLLFATTESLINKEWRFILTPCENKNKEFSRQILVAILPLGIWYAWWATLGQIDGLFHPRDIDPGNIYLRGGYIGDRFSPSNEWVAFMGGGPIVVMVFTWMHLFRKSDWPMHLMTLLLIARASTLALQLSISPQLPRLVFKISWDLVLCLFLASTLGILWGIKKLGVRRIDSVEKPLSVEVSFSVKI